jgi:transcriptional repressor NrdR
VVDSRPSPDGIRRRRVCGECKRRFTTYEKLGTPDIKVLKRGDRASEPFDHAKLVRAMSRVCEGRPVTPEMLARIARHIEADLLDQRRASVPSWEIAGMVLESLKELDQLAYARFASDYLDEDGNLRVEPGPPPANPALPVQQLGLFGEDD